MQSEFLRQTTVIFTYCRWETSTTCRMDHDDLNLKFEFLRPWGMAMGTSFVIWIVKPVSICIHGCWRFSWSLWWPSYMWSIHPQQVCNDVLILYTCWFSHYLCFDKIVWSSWSNELLKKSSYQMNSIIISYS